MKPNRIVQLRYSRILVFIFDLVKITWGKKSNSSIKKSYFLAAVSYLLQKQNQINTFYLLGNNRKKQN